MRKVYNVEKRKNRVKWGAEKNDKEIMMKIVTTNSV